MKNRSRKEVKIPIRKGMPLHLKNRLDRWYMLVRFATLRSGLYGVPIYLVGSALQDDNDDPRDWDLRCRFTNQMFEVKFGSVNDFLIEAGTGMWTRVSHRWSIECVKASKKAWKETHLNVDLQIQTPEQWLQHKNSPRLRLDMRDLLLKRCG